MDRQDWITFLLAIGIVIGMAVIVNLPKFLEGGTVASEETAGASLSGVYADGSCCTPKIHYRYNTQPQTGPFRIYYNYNLNEIYSPGATGYPRIHFPEYLQNPTGDVASSEKNIYYNIQGSIYGSSDIFSNDIWVPGEVTTFAYMDEGTSGFSDPFGAPYPVWRIRASMLPEDNPAYSSLMWILVDSSTGDIITGGIILPGDEILKKVEVSNKIMYFLIEADNVASFKIELETPEISYDEAHINPKISDLIYFLNTMKN